VTQLAPADLSTERLAALVTAKLKILELLVGLARKQLTIVETGEISDLVKLLAAKQTVLSQLQTLERQLDPFRLQDPEARRWNSASDRARCQADAHRCDELLAESLRLEKQGEAIMLRRRDAAASVLQGVNAAVEAQAAYDTPLAAAVSPLHVHCEG
jgi:flagellar biosynthesis/type III secretory pathway chaperone